MDLMPENPIVPEKKTSKSMISLIIVLILIVLLIVAAVGILVYSNNLKTETFKVAIDGINNSNVAKEGDIFLIQDNRVYTSIEDICGYIAYKYYTGEYKQFEEDRTKGYVTNQKEVVSFASGSKELKKYPVEGEELSQSFEIDEEVIMQGNKLYISEQGLSRMFNLLISYDNSNNSINITTLPYLTNYYEQKIQNAALEKSEFPDSVKFNNEKALLRGLIVIKDEDEDKKLFGVAKIGNDGNISEEVMQPRFKQVEYMEGSDDFIVTTSDQKVGIYGSDGLTKVKPSYDSIEVIDKNIGLYLAKSNNKSSVINNNGKIIIYPDFDSIGLDVGSYQDTNVTNRYLLFGNCIPVKLGKKWGIFDKNGENIVEVKYDGIGYSENVSTGQKNVNGIVIIPEMQGIVIELDRQDETTGVILKKYGIINATTGELMVNINLDSAYSTTTANVTTYYVTIQDQLIDIVNWWHDQRADEGNTNNGNTNTVNNNNSNNNGSNNTANNNNGSTNNGTTNDVNNNEVPEEVRKIDTQDTTQTPDENTNNNEVAEQ